MSNTMISGFRVARAGPLALLQDAGRFGVRHLGITQGGPADLHAWAWANRLTGNDWGAAVLEVTFGGLELVAERDMTIALTGADLGIRHNQQPAPRWRTLVIRSGDVLSFSAPVSGLRAYLAVSGGFRGTAVLGSVASVTREQLGGFDGQGSSLRSGDRLAITRSEATGDERQAPEWEQPDYRHTATLDLLPGAQIAAFTGSSLFEAFNALWRVDQRADRMGVRLIGPALRCAVDSLISEGISLGAVQVPPDGQPIVLLNDRQTIGGYPRLGNLTPLAASRLAQCLPGQAVRFRATGIDRALRQHRDFLSRFR
ncbi:allophanate hydrolase [Marinobacter lipolyticus]|nr:biotin-dependent carboxyltransferase family protein [Marinobacter lipolyticus]MBS8240923.1 allophanate hydrolase [Marinobacter lipolyticus]